MQCTYYEDSGAFTLGAVVKQEVLTILKVCPYSGLRYPRPNRILCTSFYVNRGLPGSTTFLHIISLTTIFFLGGGGGGVEDKMCFGVLCNFWLEHFLFQK